MISLTCFDHSCHHYHKDIQDAYNQGCSTAGSKHVEAGQQGEAEETQSGGLA